MSRLPGFREGGLRHEVARGCRRAGRLAGMLTATRGVRKWSDAITVAGAKLELIGCGRFIVWKLAGSVATMTPGQRLELAFAWWQRVRMGRGSVWDVLALLFPDADGGTRRGGLRDGVVYVHHE